nr:MAG TPA: hypothetical protein [Siphoviridae sp. ctngg6]
MFPHPLSPIEDIIAYSILFVKQNFSNSKIYFY